MNDAPRPLPLQGLVIALQLSLAFWAMLLIRCSAERLGDQPSGPRYEMSWPLLCLLPLRPKRLASVG